MSLDVPQSVAFFGHERHSSATIDDFFPAFLLNDIVRWFGPLQFALDRKRCARSAG
jgi:hypothetical protein